jgi:hypothetical protein
LSPIAIQNDNVIGTGRRVQTEEGSRDVPALEPMEPFATSGAWLNVDDQIGLVTEAGFRYVPAGQYTRRSAAEDLVTPDRGKGGTRLLVAPRLSAAETERLAREFSVRRVGRFGEVQLRDGPDGPLVSVTVDLGRAITFLPPADISVRGQVAEGYGLEKMTDGDPESFAVFRNAQGRGPVPESPVILEFSKPAEAEDAFALRLVPRPRYGPREIGLEIRRHGAWQRLATAQVDFRHKDLELAGQEAAERFRLTITRTWDRGAELSDAPRDTQIAELSFLVDEEEESPGTEAPAPFQLRVIEPDGT